MGQHIELVINEINGEGLLSMDSNGSSDPYLKIVQGEVLLCRTPVIKTSLNPSWTENITITLGADTDFVTFKVHCA